MNPLWVLGRLGDSAVVPPVGVADGAKEFYDRPRYIDGEAIRRLTLKAENNARVALLMAILEADEL